MNLSNDQIKALILALEGGFMHHSRRRLFSESFIKQVMGLLDELDKEVEWGPVEALRKRLDELAEEAFDQIDGVCMTDDAEAIRKAVYKAYEYGGNRL